MQREGVLSKDVHDTRYLMKGQGNAKDLGDDSVEGVVEHDGLAWEIFEDKEAGDVQAQESPGC